MAIITRCLRWFGLLLLALLWAILATSALKPCTILVVSSNQGAVIHVLEREVAVTSYQRRRNEPAFSLWKPGDLDSNLAPKYCRLGFELYLLNGSLVKCVIPRWFLLTIASAGSVCAILWMLRRKRTPQHGFAVQLASNAAKASAPPIAPKPSDGGIGRT